MPIKLCKQFLNCEVFPALYQSCYGDIVGNTVEENSSIIPCMSVLVAISKGIQAVKLLQQSPLVF